jgi:hypothetical protein
MSIDGAENSAAVDVMPHATRLLRVILALALPTVLAGTGSATGG